MKCPKCNEEINDSAKFCPKCGANIQEEENRKKELEEKKRLEELKKQEEQKREEERIEAEKEQAIKQAKEEGIELEIIDKEPKKEEVQAPVEEKKEFKVKKQSDTENKKEKKKKIKLKKNIFQILFEKLLFIIIVAALAIGGVYYCYKQEVLPEFAQKTVKDFDQKLQNVIKLNKEVKENRDKNNVSKTEDEKENWELEPTIQASDIKDLTNEVSIFVKDNKEGLLDNKTGNILLDAKYIGIYNVEYYETDKTEADKSKGIVVKDGEKYYNLDSKYQPSKEVTTIAPVEEDAYFYDHHDSVIYSTDNTAAATKIMPSTGKKQLKICTDIDIITTEGISASSEALPEKFIIDFEKSKLTTKGYFDRTKGELIIDCDYEEALDFSEGYAAVKEEKGKAGIIDETGKKVIDLKYDETRSVHNGLAFVKKDGKWGIMRISL